MRLQRAPHAIRPRAIGQYAVYPTYSTSLGCGCGPGLGNEPPPDQGGPAAPVEKPAAQPSASGSFFMAALLGFAAGALAGSFK